MKRILNLLGTLCIAALGAVCVIGGQALDMFPGQVSADQAIKAGLALNPMYLQPGYIYLFAIIALFILSAIMWRAAERVS